jgi:sulfate transport system ATP-binding protein
VSVVVEHLRKRFTQAGTPAVDDVSFVAKAGTITSLLGPSGSGKTTVLRMIAGLEHPEEGGGRVLLNDEDCTHMPVQRRGIGFVFQGYALFQHRNVRKNIAFGLEVQRLSRRAIAERVDELLELVQLRDLGARYPDQLSGGQRQRVAFARALATRPRVLLLDEPFGALDSRVRVELRAWLRELHERVPVTTLLVTHDQEEAFELSDRVVVMHGGRVAQVGAPHEIYDHPATPFVASFIGQASALKAQAPDGSDAVAFVRPHEVKLERYHEGAREHEQGTVLTAKRVGPQVRLDVRLHLGEVIAVRLTQEEAAALGVQVGDRVVVQMQKGRVFVGDYSI